MSVHTIRMYVLYKNSKVTIIIIHVHTVLWLTLTIIHLQAWCSIPACPKRTSKFRPWTKSFSHMYRHRRLMFDVHVMLSHDMMYKYFYNIIDEKPKVNIILLYIILLLHMTFRIPPTNYNIPLYTAVDRHFQREIDVMRPMHMHVPIVWQEPMCMVININTVLTFPMLLQGIERTACEGHILN